MIDSIPGSLANGPVSDEAIEEPVDDAAHCCCPDEASNEAVAADPAEAIVSSGADYVDSLVDAGVITPEQGTALAEDTELLLTVGALVNDGADTASLGVADTLVEGALAELDAPAEEAGGSSAIGRLLEEAGVPPEVVQLLTGEASDAAPATTTGTVSANGETDHAHGADHTRGGDHVHGAEGRGAADVEHKVDGESEGGTARSGGAEGPTPEQLALSRRAAAGGQRFVDALVDAGSLTPERASQLLADPGLAAQIGTLTADGSAEGARAAEVLITDVGTSAGPADEHLSGLARSGAIDLDAFKALANDGDFLASLLPHLTPAAEGGEAPDAAAADLMIDQAVGNLAAGRPADAGAGEVFESRDGLLFRAAGVPEAPQVSGTGPDGETVDPAAVQAKLAESALERPAYVTADGQPFPPELQERLDATASTPEGIDPYTLGGARLLTATSAGEGSPTELFAARSYQGGLTDLDTFLAQANDPAFLEDPSTARAAEVLFGGGSGPYAGAEQFTASLFSDGHIDQATFVEHANDPAFLADVQTQMDAGTVTYTSENFGAADALLGKSDDEIREILAPGFDFNAGPPSAEQIAALHQVGQSDQQFIELATAWVTEHNPDLQLRFGHPDEAAADAGEPEGFFWTNAGEVTDDPFLNSLTEGLAKQDGDNAEHKEPELGTSDKKLRLFKGDDTSFEVRLKFEGISGDPKDETTDASRHAVSLVFPDKDIKDVLRGQDGVGIDVDDHLAEGVNRGGIDGRARAALDIVAPDLLGVQVTWADGTDGLQVTNSTKFDSTVVRANDAGAVDVQTGGNAGDLNVVVSGDTQFDGQFGSGEELIQDTPNGASAVGDAFDPVTQRDALVDEALGSGLFVEADGSFDLRSFGAALDSQQGLSDADRQYIFQQVSGAVNAGADAQPA